jgi:hypothetical protein
VSEVGDDKRFSMPGNDSRDLLMPKSSTPIKQSSVEFQLEESLSPITNSPLIIRDRNHSFFVSWVEQSFRIQEELIDDAVNEILALDRVHEVESVRIHSPRLVRDEVSYEGVGENTGISRNASAARSVLNIMKEQAARSRNTAAGYQGNNNFLREIWDRRYMGSESRLDRYNLLESESSDVATELPVFNTPAPEQRITRSKGRAENYPHVQPRVLEYKTCTKK